MYNIAFATLTITFLLNLILATIIIRRGRLGLWFGLIIYCVAFWNFTLIMFYFLVPWESTVSTFQRLYFWAKLALVGPIIIPALYLHFAIQQTQPKKMRAHLLLNLTFVPTLVLLLFVPSKYNWGSIYFTEQGIPTSSGMDIALYLPFTIYFLTYLTITFWMLFKNLKNLPSRTSAQIRYVLFGSIVTAVVAITTNSIVPMINGDFYTQIFGPVTSIIFSLSVTYAILKHRFMDIRVVINKSVVYATLTAIFVGLTAFFAMLLGNQIASEFRANILLSATIVAVMIALAFPLLHKLVQALVDKFIFRPNAHHPYMLQVTKYTLARCDTVVGLANEAERLVDESLGVHPTLFVLNTFAHEFEPTTRDRGLTRAQTNTLMNVFPCDTRLMFRDDIPRLIAANPYAENLLTDTDKMMQSRRFAAIVPLISAEAKLHGLFAIPEKENAYSQEDASFLLSFANTLERRLAEVISYEHALKGIQALLRERGRL